MTRITQADLTRRDHRWREVPMPGANLGLELLRLDSTGDTFAILGRFPAGFERIRPGGYLAAEEFIVLTGFLDIEGVRRHPGDLTYIPPRFLRTDMRAPEGCTVLAWFGGPAVFHSAERLDGAVTDGIVTVSVQDAAAGPLLSTPAADWVVFAPGEPVTEAEGDSVAVGLTWWHRLSAGTPPGTGDGGRVVRVQRG
ncbi:hypothetical protein ACFFX1_22045 [Dactylosporangium sucinum]|uniref:Uncharacterized protein n=1 Tax=Dactylosporangium sucinum TaxID=1424081 RepID=A0A917WZT4_9ACTN|nr:hypothetical protein [Dactylosporangium sucinum]GGM45982.1 hypothetical protein GCM10007977_054680 [Dactylosporangium sucinum]